MAWTEEYFQLYLEHEREILRAAVALRADGEWGWTCPHCGEADHHPTAILAHRILGRHFRTCGQETGPLVGAARRYDDSPSNFRGD